LQFGVLSSWQADCCLIYRLFGWVWIGFGHMLLSSPDSRVGLGRVIYLVGWVRLEYKRTENSALASVASWWSAAFTGPKLPTKLCLPQKNCSSHSTPPQMHTATGSSKFPPIVTHRAGYSRESLIDRQWKGGACLTEDRRSADRLRGMPLRPSYSDLTASRFPPGNT